MWGIWGSYCNIPKAIFYLLKGDYRVLGLEPLAPDFSARLGDTGMRTIPHTRGSMASPDVDYLASSTLKKITPRKPYKDRFWVASQDLIPFWGDLAQYCAQSLHIQTRDINRKNICRLTKKNVKQPENLEP